MQVFDQIARLLADRSIGSVVLEPEEPCWYLGENGAREAISDRLDATRLNALLDQATPAQHRAEYRARLPFYFVYQSEYGAVGVDVNWSRGRIRVVVTTSRVVVNEDGPEDPPSLDRANRKSAGFPPSSPSQRIRLPASSPSRAAANYPAIPVPFILGLPQQLPGILAGILGIGLGLAVSFAVMATHPAESILGRMFDRHNPATLVPVAICCMFFWGSLACANRLLRLGAIARLSAKSLLLKIVKRLGTLRIAEASELLEGPAVSASPLLRRLHAVLQQWHNAPGLVEADIVLQQHAAHDDEEVHSAYNLIRAFVWALPVLGLIGTVIGISLAVGGFAEFLGTGVDDVSLIKKNLVGVTSGLSFAFLITLLGLVTSLVLMLVASALQTRERRLNADIQQNITDHFMPVLQHLAPVAAEHELDHPATGGDALIRVAREVLAEHADRLQGMLQSQAETFARPHADLMTAIGEQNKLIRSNAELLRDVTSTNEALVETQKTLQAAWGEIRNIDFGRTIHDTAGVMSAQCRELQGLAQGMERFAGLTSQLLASQSALQEATRDLREAGFSEALSDLRSSLKSLAGVLDGFRKPFVLQAVAMSNGNHDRALT
jgi:biopolymer transport protein ExbB/TolQ